jgi:acyl-CoA thioester hydrolase
VFEFKMNETGTLVSQPNQATRADFAFWWPVTVRWGDMDALGHVNNCVFFQYLECARVGYFEATGWDSRDTTPTRQGPIVVSQTFNYRRQLHYPAEVEVGVACTEVRQRSFVLSYAVFRKESEELFGDGSTVLVWLDFAANKAVEIPPDVRAHLGRG